MLGNTARFAGGNVRITERIQQGCFTMVNVTHNRHNRCAWRHAFWVWFAFQDFCVWFDNNAFNSRTKFRRNQFRSVGINRLIHRNHHAHFHQFFDNIAGLFCHGRRQVFDRDCVTQVNNMFNLLWGGKYGARLFTETFQGRFGTAAVCATNSNFIVVIIATTHNDIIQVNLARLFEIFFRVVKFARTHVFVVRITATTRRAGGGVICKYLGCRGGGFCAWRGGHIFGNIGCIRSIRNIRIFTGGQLFANLFIFAIFTFYFRIAGGAGSGLFGGTLFAFFFARLGRSQNGTQFFIGRIF